MKDGFLLMAAGMVLVTVLLGYFLGCLNGSVMVSHFVIKDDVRQHGSGNAGLTNFYRTYGAKYALGVILFDMGKTVIACLLGGFLLRHGLGDWTLGVLIGGLGCELGHMFPVFFGFRGGKGILCGFTIALAMDWRIGLLIFVVFALTFVLTHYVSLGSLLVYAGFMIEMVVFGQLGVFGDSISQMQLLEMYAVTAFLTILAYWKHRQNIVRLVHGEERKTYLTKKNKLDVEKKEEAK